MKNELIAMILAGGQGSRLGKLTKETAKPAVSFGGRYRIIDFALSNCANSGINKIGVVTQYQPLELNAHIGNGASWGLTGRDSGVTILQPYSSSDGEKWFDGTAHAIYQNIDFIDSCNPTYVLILSGDHIYKMDYERMLEFHKKKDASLTVGVIEVDLAEASRFGIMNTDKSDQIIEFEEKPSEPKSNLASMGIYIFDWKKLREYLIASHELNQGLEDFGKDVIPAYLENNENVYAYSFDGYWKDVGTIESLWEANMELINPKNALNLGDSNWRIYSKSLILPPQFISNQGMVNNSIVVDGCKIEGKVEQSTISSNVMIGKNSKVNQSVIMPNAVIGDNVYIDHAIIGEEAHIESGASVVGENEIKVIGYGEIVGGTES